jgi:hypothetical protein
VTIHEHEIDLLNEEDERKMYEQVARKRARYRYYSDDY